MNQREKDITVAASQGIFGAYDAAAFADGAEYARKELFERLRQLMAESFMPESLEKKQIRALAKEYGL